MNNRPDVVHHVPTTAPRGRGPRILGKVGSASCSFSSPTRSSIFKNEFSLLASFEFIFNGSLFGFLRVIASFSLVSWCGKQAMRTRARQQASESSGDSRELPGIAVLFSGVVAPTNEEKRLKRSFQGCKP